MNSAFLFATLFCFNAIVSEVKTGDISDIIDTGKKLCDTIICQDKTNFFFDGYCCSRELKFGCCQSPKWYVYAGGVAGGILLLCLLTCCCCCCFQPCRRPRNDRATLVTSAAPMATVMTTANDPGTLYQPIPLQNQPIQFGGGNRANF